MTVHARIDSALSRGETHHFADVSPDNGQRQMCHQLHGSLRPVRRPAGTYRVEHDRNSLSGCCFTGFFHRIDGPRLESPHIENQRRGSTGHFSCFSRSPGHGRRCSYGQRRIGTIVDGDDIGYMVDEWPLLLQALQCLSCFL